MDTNKSTKVILQLLEHRFGQNPNFSLDDYLHAFGNEHDALLYSTLFLPEIVEIEGSVFLTRNIRDQSKIAEEIRSNGKKNSEVESSYNFIEVGYLFSCNGRNLGDEEELLLANRICESWKGWLKIRYPVRNFVVEVLPPSVTGSTVGIHFFELR